MAKAYLLRRGFQEEFDRIDLYARELGFTDDTNRLLVGDGEKNIHIPNEQFVASMVATGVLGYKPKTGTTAELDLEQANGTFAYNTDTQRVVYRSPTGVKSILARASELNLNDPLAFVVAAANIDAGNSNSVLLSDFTRPTRTLFLNGKLCTQLSSDPHAYTYDAVAKTVSIKECVEGDIISYL